MKKYWVNVYERDAGRQWEDRAKCIWAAKVTDNALGKLLYRIHVKMKENPKPVQYVTRPVNDWWNV